MRATEKNEVFGDYAAFLNALLPNATGFMFHDRHARLFWHDNALWTPVLVLDQFEEIFTLHDAE